MSQLASPNRSTPPDSSQPWRRTSGLARAGIRSGAACAWLLCSLLITNAQTAIQVGAGSYASSIPPADQWIGGFYSMSPQQVVTQYPNLHLDPALTNRPIPSNQWWTDLLVADRSYQPQGGGPRVMQQDPYGGQLWAYPVLLAPNASGFNLYYPNAWNARSSPNFPEGGFNTGPALPITGSIPAAVGTNDILIADFNGTNYPSGWVTTGTAFGTGPVAGGTWPGELPAVQGFIGNACVNTYRGSDTPQGTLTSPAFTIQKKYIHLLAGGGNNTNNAAVWLMVGTNVVRAATGQQWGTLYWNTWDVTPWLGQSAQIKLVDLTSGSWGFILCSWIVASDDGSNPAGRYGSAFSPVQSVVTGWSDWGVQFALPDALGRRMDITLARGVPFVWTTCSGVNPTLNIGAGTLYDTSGAAISLTNGGSFVASAFSLDYQGRSYGVFAPDNTTFLAGGGSVTAQLSGTNHYLVYGLLPARTNLNEFAGYAYARVTGTAFNWTYDRTNGQVNTRWSLATTPLKGSQTNTLQGWLPHHYRTTQPGQSFKPYSYLTPRGIMKVAAGSEFQINYSFRGLAPVLPAPRPSGLANDYAGSRMTNYLLSFAAGHPYNVGDSYGAGKEMGLAAQYLGFARQLGMTNQAAQLAAGLRGILTNWLTYAPGKTSYFFARYDNWRGLIGFPPGYGSEAFNDNHFHYGYFMVAAALLGMEDTNFLVQFGPMAKLVAREYANWDRGDTDFPFLRTFDIWEGHSCAGGFSSGGGENQESSSEAMNSWVGLFLAGNMLGDDAMTAAGAMGYAIESSAVNEYWQDMYRSNLPPSYGKGTVGILWSGALSYGTYFTGDPAWIHGIQWVPANHWNNYLARDPAFARWQLTNMWQERITASQYGINGFTLADDNDAPAQGSYLGNYVLGFQALFDADGVAATLDAAYATNAAIATDPTYSGVSYYLAHSLRGLGEQDPDAYTSIPTSQVYTNARTGRRTVIIYNPAQTDQLATLFQQGAPVGAIVAPARMLTVNLSGPTNTPARFPVFIKPGAQLNWPTSSNKLYDVQWADTQRAPAWTGLGSFGPGDGGTNSLFDALWPAPHRYYRVLERSQATPSSIVVNGGFESGSGSTADSWTRGGSQPPIRISTNACTGASSMLLMVANASSTPNNSEISQNIASQGGPAVVPGQPYNFSFRAFQVNAGPSLVQNYKVTWLDNTGANIGDVGWISFTGGNGAWTQVTANNLVAPAKATNALITVYATTGAVLHGYGAVLIDDVTLAPATASPGQTNEVPSAVRAAVRLSWPSASDRLYSVQSADALGAGMEWANWASLQGNGAANVIVDLVGTNLCRFYRVIER